MQKLIIKGRRDLSGKISISGSKNATLQILAASILSNQATIKNVPLVKDIFTMVELLNFIGLKTKIIKKENTIEIKMIIFLFYMNYSYTEKKRIRKKFGKIKQIIDIPSMLQIQSNSCIKKLQY